MKDVNATKTISEILILWGHCPTETTSLQEITYFYILQYMSTIFDIYHVVGILLAVPLLPFKNLKWEYDGVWIPIAIGPNRSLNP